MVPSNMASGSAFQPPELFTISKPEEWPRWIWRFKLFRDASGFDEKDKSKQISTLIYSMGEEAEDILQSFRLTAEQQESYTAVKNKFGSFLIKRRNIVFERCRFNQRRQKEGEYVASVINDVCTLAEHCGYGELQEELIRDRLQ